VSFIIPTRTAAEIANGTMSITKSGSITPTTITFWDGTLPVPATVTKFSLGDTLNFTGAAGKNGVLDAFKVRAYDGIANPVGPAQVNIKLDPFGTQFNLTGSWAGTAGLAKVTQNGASISVIDSANNGASVTF